MLLIQSLGPSGEVVARVATSSRVAARRWQSALLLDLEDGTVTIDEADGSGCPIRRVSTARIRCATSGVYTKI